jgi:pyruvate dehydrogenase E2 component (dihydrolipoamide acetyltransferase)
MATPVKMPELGESITEGTITRWLKQEGDRVEADEPLFEVSTDKVDTEVPSPVSGVLTSIKVAEDETVEVGAELAEIDQDGQAGGDQGREEARGGPVEAEAERDQGDQGEAEAASVGEREAVAAEDQADQVAAEDQGDRAAATADQDREEDREAPRPAGTAAEDQEADREAPAAAGSDGGAQAGGDGQATTVTMPELGESITEGTITRWLKQEGDRVEADEPLFEVSTDKVDTEVPSPVAGTLQSIKVAEDETVEVGADLAVISTGAGRAEARPRAEAEAEAEPSAKAEPEPEAEVEGEGAAAAGREERAPAAEGAPAGAGYDRARADEEAEAAGEERGVREARPAAAAAGDGAKDGGARGVVVSPLVRRLAREHDVDLSQVKGSGSGGRVRREDVEAYLEGRGKQAEPAAAAAAETREARPAARAGDGRAAPAKEAKPAAGAPKPQVTPLPTGVREEVVPATRLRRIIAERMVSSLATSAQLTAAVEIDMTKVMRLRQRAKEKFKAREGVSLSPLPLAILAVIQAIREYPMANAALDEDMNLHVYKDVNMGIAVDTPKGLFVPVIRNADQLNLAGLARAIAGIAKRTREGKIGPNELSGSTFTVTNTGSVGTVWDTPIINQPNAAIFATPAIVKRPVVVDDPELGEVIAVRHMMYGIITYDHRILDGADAARFLQKVKQVLEAGDFARELGLDEDGG